MQTKKQIVTRTRKSFFSAPTVVAALAASTIVAPSSKAVVLEHKWQAGQQLPYNVTLKGNMNAQTDASWAGRLTNMPIDIALSGNGRWVLNTLSVDSAGNGTVQVQVPQLSVKGSAWGMGATLKVENGQATAGLNGAPGKTFDVSQWTNPSTAIVVSRNAQVQSVAPIAPTASSSTSSTRSADVANNAAQTMNNLARFMPQLWPGRDIAVGETWTIDAKVPLGSDANAQQLSVGAFTLKLEAEENEGGRVLQRVGVNGTIDVSGDKAQAINEAAKSKNANAPRVISAMQNVTGSILFDANAGQIARAWFKVNAKNELRGTSPAQAKKPAQNWTLKHGFDGTIQVQQG